MDGTEKQVDALLTGQPSPGESQETPKPEAKTYTEQEVQKQISDALAKAGRDAKTLADREASLTAQQGAIQAREAEVAEIQRQVDEAELEAARYDPDKLRAYQARQAEKHHRQSLEVERRQLAKEKAELDRSKAEHEAELQAARQAAMEAKVYEIAAKHEVNPAILKDLKLTTVEQLETVAKHLGGMTPKEQSAEAAKMTPDSGVTIGAGESSEGKPSWQIFSDHIANKKQK